MSTWTSDRPEPGRAAFTLAETALALSLVAVAVVTMAILFPTGIRTQQDARFRLYAAAKAMELISAFNCADNGNASLDYESYAPWDAPTSYRNLAPDFESRVACRSLGCAPVPLEIARRIDSDGDEIARALDAGGRLYYSQAAGSTGMRETDLPLTPPPDALKLVFIVSGSAQENAYNTFPWKAWPYRTAYPSPPTMAQHWPDFLGADGKTTPSGCLEFGMRDVPDMRMYDWEETIDPDIRIVMHWAADSGPTPDIGECYGFQQYAYPTPPTAGATPPRSPFSLPPTTGGGGPLIDPSTYVDTTPGQPNSAIRYLQAALAYAVKKGYASLATSGLVSDFTPSASAGWSDEHWKQVQTMRFLASAGTCLTRWYGNQLGGGVAIPSVAIDGATTPAITVTHQRLLDWHESCLRLVTLFCASYPYDWAVQRISHRQLGWDYPLIQPDLFRAPATGPVFGTPCTVDGKPLPAQTAAQWHAVAAQDVRHIGGSYAYPDAPIDECGDGHDKRHFSLCAPFAPAERCRELVFFAVDWMAYVDCETCPSAPVDACKYRKGAEQPGRGFDWLCNARQTWHDVSLLHFRNDEGAFTFILPVDGRPTGDDVRGFRYGDVYNHYGIPLVAANGNRPEVVAAGLDSIPDQGLAPKYVAVFNGLYGADRNWNGKLDRGPIPRSVRMRAITLARYNFYDPRVPFKVR